MNVWEYFWLLTLLVPERVEGKSNKEKNNRAGEWAGGLRVKKGGEEKGKNKEHIGNQIIIVTVEVGIFMSSYFVNVYIQDIF